MSIIERPSLHPHSGPKNPDSLPNPGFSLFSIIFEVVSGYGTVGFSLGVPYDDYSFCGVWRSLSKLVLIAVMVRGRHRILPLAIDRAVLLPGQGLMERLDRETNFTGVARGRADEGEQAAREREQGKRAVREKLEGKEVESSEHQAGPEDGHESRNEDGSGSKDEELEAELGRQETGAGSSG